ncbi:MAG: hypothetical protein ACK5TN_11065 [Acidobacteriota bacterium]
MYAALDAQVNRLPEPGRTGYESRGKGMLLAFRLGAIRAWRQLFENRGRSRHETFVWTLVCLPILTMFGLFENTVWKTLPYRNVAQLYVLEDSVPGLEGMSAWVALPPQLSEAGWYRQMSGSLRLSNDVEEEVRSLALSAGALKALGLGEITRVPGMKELQAGRPVWLKASFARKIGYGPGSFSQGRLGALSIYIAGVLPDGILQPWGSDLLVMIVKPEDAFYKGTLALSTLVRLREGVQRPEAETIVTRLSGSRNEAATKPQLKPVASVLFAQHAQTVNVTRQLTVALCMLGLIAIIGNYLLDVLADQQALRIRLQFGARPSYLWAESAAAAAIPLLVTLGIVSALLPAMVNPIASVLGLEVEPRALIGNYAKTLTLALSSIPLLALVLGGLKTKLVLLSTSGDLRGAGNSGASRNNERGWLWPQLIVLFAIQTLSVAMVIYSLFHAWETYRAWQRPTGLTQNTVLAFPAKTAKEWQSVINRLRPAQPGFIGMASHVPMDRKPGFAFLIDGYIGSPTKRRIAAFARTVDEHYHQALGIRILSGRSFDARLDRKDGGCRIVINDALSRELGGDANGRRLKLPGSVGECEIVGIAANHWNRGWQESYTPELDFYSGQYPDAELALVVNLGSPRAVGMLNLPGSLVSPTEMAQARTLDELRYADLEESIQATWIACLVALLAVSIVGFSLYSYLLQILQRQKMKLAIQYSLGAPGLRLLASGFLPLIATVWVSIVSATVLCLKVSLGGKSNFVVQSEAVLMIAACLMCLISLIVGIACWRLSRRLLNRECMALLQGVI